MPEPLVLLLEVAWCQSFCILAVDFIGQNRYSSPNIEADLQEKSELRDVEITRIYLTNNEFAYS